jgi:L-ascorbate peroxidase
MATSSPDVETEVREFIVAYLPREHAPAFLRLAFHDAGTYDVQTHTGGAHGAIHLVAEMGRDENRGWAVPCLDLLDQIKERYPDLSWADLVAVGGAAAVQKCGGPVIVVGLGRIDATEPAPDHRLPATDEGVQRLEADFLRMGLTERDLVALSGGHTLGYNGGRPFTRDPYAFSNAYFQRLLAPTDDPGTSLLPSDRALLDDPELRPFVELYARDEAAFYADFAAAYQRLTWLGGDPP